LTLKKELPYLVGISIIATVRCSLANIVDQHHKTEGENKWLKEIARAMAKYSETN